MWVSLGPLPNRIRTLGGGCRGVPADVVMGEVASKNWHEDLRSLSKINMKISNPP